MSFWVWAVIAVGVALALLLARIAIGTPTRRLEARREKAAELRREAEERLASAGQAPAMQAVIPVPAQAKAAGALFNRFGIRNLEQGGHDVIVYLDDLRYTVGPGDVGPVERCGASAT
jgi:hypothetical protein